MSSKQSPSIRGISPEDLEALRVMFQNVEGRRSSSGGLRPLVSDFQFTSYVGNKASELLGTTPDDLFVSAAWCTERSGLLFTETRGTPPFSRRIRIEGMTPDALVRDGAYFDLRETLCGIPFVRVAVSALTYTGPGHVFVIVKKKDYRRMRTAVVRFFNSKDEISAPILQDNLLEDIKSFVIDYRKNWAEYKKWGARTGRGLLLDGPPGNGKTMICRYLQQKIVDMHGSWTTVTMGMLDEADAGGELAELLNGSDVIFLDDIDISYLNRQHNGRRACALLTAMDGPSSRPGVVRVFTTNEAVNSLDAAFLRPGRIDRIITILPPDEGMRSRLIESWPKEIRDSIDIQKLTKDTEGMNFSEVELVRSLMVDYFMKTGKWDVNQAMSDFVKYREQDKNNSDFVGFGK